MKIDVKYVKIKRIIDVSLPITLGQSGIPTDASCSFCFNMLYSCFPSVSLKLTQRSVFNSTHDLNLIINRQYALSYSVYIFGR